MSVWIWVALTILILANSLYVAAEFGAVGVRRSRVRRLADDGHRLARRLLPYVEDPAKLDRYVGTSQIGITASSLTLGAYAQATLGYGLALRLRPWFDPAAATSIAAAVVLISLTAVQLIVGELVPKALALQYPTEVALATVLPLEWSLVVFRPVIAVLNGSATFLLRLFGAVEGGHRHLHSPEEIDLLIAESRDGGLLEPVEQERLRRALRLAMRTARDLMVPRAELTMLDVASSWDDVVKTVIASPFSRIPVFRGTPDRIVGMLRVKDLADRFAIEGPLPLETLMRPVGQLREDVTADRVVAELRAHRAHAAIIVDAAGKTAGLVTIQDVLGELLGLRPSASGAAKPEPGRSMP